MNPLLLKKEGKRGKAAHARVKKMTISAHHMKKRKRGKKDCPMILVYEKKEEKKKKDARGTEPNGLRARAKRGGGKT